MASVYQPVDGRHTAPQTWDASPCTWRVVGASSIGASHQKQNLPCQDAQAHRVVSTPEGEILLVAVADGAGSAEYSDQGASCAVEAALQALENALLEGSFEQPDYAGLLYLAFERARQAVLDLSEEQSLPLRSLATTLTLALAQAEVLVAGQLGDGTVIAHTRDGEFIAVTQPQRGEYANETFFLTQEDALEQLEMLILESPLQGLAVMSDGLMRLAMKMPNNEPHVPFFSPLFAFAGRAVDPQPAVEQLEGFLASDRVCARTDDDKSLVLAVCLPALAAEPQEQEQAGA